MFNMLLKYSKVKYSTWTVFLIDLIYSSHSYIICLNVFVLSLFLHQQHYELLTSLALPHSLHNKQEHLILFLQIHNLGKIIPVNLLLGLGVKLIKHEKILMGEVDFILIKYISVSPFILLAHFPQKTYCLTWASFWTRDNRQQIPMASLRLIIFKQPILSLNFQRRVQISIPPTA